jgi:hypothetical protein
MFNASLEKFSDHSPLAMAGLLIAAAEQVENNYDAGVNFANVADCYDWLAMFHLLDCWGGEGIFADFPGLVSAIGPVYSAVSATLGALVANDRLGELGEAAIEAAEAAQVRRPVFW